MELIKIHFFGGAGTVTGSKFLIETTEHNILIDCGMFQGLKELRQQNWDYLPFEVYNIDVVLLTHGHLDHVGYLPRLVQQGFKGNIIGTEPTLRIAEIILRDSAKIYEEDAERANKEEFTKHRPAKPYYNTFDVEKVLQQFHEQKINSWVSCSKNISYQFQYNGHIIGATFITLNIFGKYFVFSGDIGRKEDLLLYPPKKPKKVDYLFLESTYGNKNHPQEEVELVLQKLIQQTIYNRGILIIPSFAVERTQHLMYLFWQLYKKRKIPNIPIIMDSPMGKEVFHVFSQFKQWHKLTEEEYTAMSNHINIIEHYKETWETIDNPEPKIVIAGSGMITGGRVLTYLKRYIGNPSTIVLLVGYMAEGTRGRHLLEGVQEIKIHGNYYPVKAQITSLQSLSAHADQSELTDWINEITNIPEKIFLIHGETPAAEALKQKIEEVYKWNVHIPKCYEVAQLWI